MAAGSRLGLAAVALAMVLVAAPPASAVKSGRYRGTDISFRVKDNRISKVKVVLTYSCQKIGSGELPSGEVRQLVVPGKFKVSSKGRFKNEVYIGSNNGVTDIYFTWSGRFRKGKASATVKAGYKYWGYEAGYGPRLVRCDSVTALKAKRV